MSSFHQIPSPNTHKQKSAQSDQQRFMIFFPFPAPTPFRCSKSKKNTWIFMASRHLSPALIIHEIPSNHPWKFSFCPPNLVNKSPLKFHRSPCAIHSVIIKRWTTTKWKSQSHQKSSNICWIPAIFPWPFKGGSMVAPSLHPCSSYRATSSDVKGPIPAALTALTEML